MYPRTFILYFEERCYGSKVCLCVCVPQVRGGVNGQLFSLSNGANTRTITDGIAQRGSSEVVYRSFSDIPNDVYYWVLPDSFRGDKVREGREW